MGDVQLASLSPTSVTSSRSLSPNASTTLSLKSSSVGEIDLERERDDLLGGGGECRLLATRDCVRSFFSLANFFAFCSLFVFGGSSVGLCVRCGGCVVSGILAVLRQKKLVAVELVKLDCLLMALCGTVIK